MSKTLRHKEEKTLNAKKFMIVMIILGIIALSTTYALAAGNFHTCTVEAAGPGGNGTFIKLHDVNSNGAYWCVPRATREKEMLAVALTAMANDMQVSAFFDDTDRNPIIGTLYLKP